MHSDAETFQVNIGHSMAQKFLTKVHTYPLEKKICGSLF